MALPTKLTLEIVTPDRALVTEQVDEVELPGSEGYFGVLPGHSPLLASLQVGELWYRIGTEKHFLSVAFGFVEVLPEHVTVLARIAEKAQDIDVARAEAAKKRAEERIAYLAHHDSLTGLPNRTAFNQRLTSTLDRAAANGESFSSEGS